MNSRKLLRLTHDTLYEYGLAYVNIREQMLRSLYILDLCLR
jgi:hypothetical protein